MRIYIIGNDGITLCCKPPTALNDGEIAVASNEELQAARLTTFCCSTARQNAVPRRPSRAGPVPKSRTWSAGCLLSARMLTTAER